ncbi:hypothetical protein EUGRSUZ_F00548 [Eucalyptus grandis]|uniref:Uncharacterized protein n=2 Tax=Eucalyptus grandis TaxID=71139 RepID=A0ACC3KBQ0_EUCGR|nr:hypothetical protein EUGRSUZ_F00548 [Eucalyptus grandis]
MWSIPVKLPFMRYDWSLHASSRIQDMLKELVQEKKVKLEQQTAAPHQDLITCLLSKHNEENEQVVTDKEILHNIVLVMVAGHDTSSILIAFMLRLLCKNPDVCKAVFQASRDIEYGGYLIPRGWQVFWASNVTHMGESIFPKPSKFDPSRFEKQKSIPPYSFIPFGGGPHICPGNEFVRIETLVAIHSLVTLYSWELCSDDHYVGDPLLVPTQGLLFQIVPKIRK